MKKILLLVLVVTLFASCGNEKRTRENGATTDNVKRERSDKYLKRVQNIGIRHTTGIDSIKDAIVILDSAITIDPNNPRPYLLKQAFQTWLGEYKKSLGTLKTLENFKPNDPEFKSKEGLLYLLIGNNPSANMAFNQSDSLWNIRLDTVSKSNDWELLGILLGKATTLKLLGEEKQANNIYKRVLKDTTFNKPKYKEMRKTIDTLFLNQTKEEFYNYLVRGFENNKSPNR